MTTIRNTVTTEGCALAYSQRGHGPPVLFIQGTGLHGAGWDPQTSDLAEDHTCLWFDNRGIGGSQPAGKVRLSVSRMAADAVAILDHAGWPAAHVVGHSLGGCIATELALAHPSRVLSLSLLCTGADGRQLANTELSSLWRGVRMMVGSRRSRRSAFLELILTPTEHRTRDHEMTAQELTPIFGHDLVSQPPILWRQARALAGWSATARLSEIRQPTLVVGAALDLIAKPAIVRELARGIHGSVLIELEDAAHGVPATHPERINPLLRDHLRSQNGSSAEFTLTQPSSQATPIAAATSSGRSPN